MRFLFCACAISYMLNDWSGVDVDRAIKFIKNCRSYDGAISLIAGQVRTLYQRRRAVLLGYTLS